MIVDRLRRLLTQVLVSEQHIPYPELDAAKVKRLATMLRVYVVEDLLDIAKPKVAAELEGLCTDARLAVLDPLRHFAGDADESSPAEFYKPVAVLRAIAARTGCACVALHHNRKRQEGDAGERLRGTTALRGASRALISLQLTSQSEHHARVRVQAECRYAPPPEPFDVVFKSVIDNMTAEFASVSLTEEIAKALRTATAPLTVAQVAQAAKCGEGTARTTLNRLKTDGKAKRNANGKAAAWEAVVNAQ